MKISKQRLKQIITEEIGVLREEVDLNAASKVVEDKIDEDDKLKILNPEQKKSIVALVISTISGINNE